MRLPAGLPVRTGQPSAALRRHAGQFLRERPQVPAPFGHHRSARRRAGWVGSPAPAEPAHGPEVLSWRGGSAASGLVCGGIGRERRSGPARR